VLSELTAAPPTERDRSDRPLPDDPKIRVFIGQIQAAGEAIDLSAPQRRSGSSRAPSPRRTWLQARSASPTIRRPAKPSSGSVCSMEASTRHCKPSCSESGGNPRGTFECPLAEKTDNPGPALPPKEPFEGETAADPILMSATETATAVEPKKRGRKPKAETVAAEPEPQIRTDPENRIDPESPEDRRARRGRRGGRG
jgi:hypothetical protein